MKKDTGRCVNCGFLGKKLEESTVSECYEVTPTDRQDDAFSPVMGVKETRPCCYRNKTQFTWDIYKKPHTTTLKAEITEDRKCPYWYPYTEFRSPKEHFEEFKMLELETRREKFEQRMEQERKEFELKLDEANRQERKITNRIMIGLTIALIVFAILQLYAVLASINPERWLFEWLR